MGARAAQAGFPPVVTASVHDALEERLQKQLRSGLPVIAALQPVLGVLPKELLECALGRLPVSKAPGSSTYQTGS